MPERHIITRLKGTVLYAKSCYTGGISRFMSKQYFTLNNGGKGIQVDTSEHTSELNFQNLILTKKEKKIV